MIVDFSLFSFTVKKSFNTTAKRDGFFCFLLSFILRGCCYFKFLNVFNLDNFYKLKSKLTFVENYIIMLRDFSLGGIAIAIKKYALDSI